MSTKQTQRTHYKTRRKNIDTTLRTQLAQKALKNLQSLQQFKNSKHPLLYASTKYELSTTPILNEFFENGETVLLPFCIDDNRLGVASVSSFDNLKTGAYEILEPNLGICSQVDSEEIDFVLLPGVAFDESGSRLGQGGGYYDRFLETLSSKVTLVGYSFEEQISSEKLILEEHDRKVNFIITPERIIEC
jgi:5-formyltetrahydrofolate cyclo-ligase